VCCFFPAVRALHFPRHQDCIDLATRIPRGCLATTELSGILSACGTACRQIFKCESLPYLRDCLQHGWARLLPSRDLEKNVIFYAVQQEILPPERSDVEFENSLLDTAGSPSHQRQAAVTSFRWSVGVTTAPRAVPTLERCLASLTRAGWDHPRIFAEPDAPVPVGLPVTRRASRMGAWPNWYLALAELVMLDPLADCYFLSQDDVVYCRHVREFLEQDLWPARETGMISLYCPSIYYGQQQLPDYGPHEIMAGFSLVGALTYLFPAASARALLQDTQVVEHRLKGHRHGLCNIDAVVGRWAQQTGRKVFYYSPALATHIGEVSSIWPNQPLRPSRTSSNFLGEEVDARALYVLQTKSFQTPAPS